jgi:chromate transporter
MPSRRLSWCCLLLLAPAIALASMSAFLIAEPWRSLFSIPFQAGSLVFGGGHVVLPLLHDPLVQRGLMTDQAFLAGYGAAQAVPGPLFTVAAWIGGLVAGVPGACLALVAIFLPGLLIALGCLRFYHGALALPWARHAVMGLNAGVVGLLGAALWHPIGHEAIAGPSDLALALAAFIALEAWRVPAWAVVFGCCALAGIHAALRGAA